MARTYLLCLCLLAVSSSLQAHQLKIFAFAERDQIAGEAYFTGGAEARGIHVELKNADGQTLTQTRSDAQGEFRFTVDERQDYLMVATTGDGHEARWRLSAEELTADWGEESDGTDSPAAEPKPDTTDRPESDVPLHTLIERAVARQVNPLREQLIHLEDRLRLQDVLGGLGYIAGLAGLALCWHSRRPETKR